MRNLGQYDIEINDYGRVHINKLRIFVTCWEKFLLLKLDK
jgi:hypothetical protein